jgi:hypothetical protein
MIIACVLPCYAYGLIVGTYNAPPFSMYEDDMQLGLVTEVVSDILAKANLSDFKIVNYPLARGLVELKQKRIDIFYPYMNEQQQLVQGIRIGPISKYRLGLFVRADNTAEVSLQTMQQQMLAAERGGLGNDELQQQNFKMELTTDKTSCLTMVVGKRVACCAVGVLPGMYLAALNNMYAKLRYVETPIYSDVYLLLGPSVAPEVVTAIQNAYAQLQTENYFEKKQADYEQKFKIFIDSMQ